MNKEIKKLIEAMYAIKGEDVEISIFHKLYGSQKLRCEFNPILDERIGFNIKGQCIYIDKNRITKIRLVEDIFFSDDIMEIMIKFK